MFGIVPVQNSAAGQGRPSIQLSYLSGWTRAFVHYNVDGKGVMPGHLSCLTFEAFSRLHLSAPKVDPMMTGLLSCSLSPSQDTVRQSRTAHQQSTCHEMLLTVHLLAVMYFHETISLDSVSIMLDWAKGKRVAQLCTRLLQNT